eukprot:scaffold14199_cov183-Amphora_coffeaeformis.AAC.4
MEEDKDQAITQTNLTPKPHLVPPLNTESPCNFNFKLVSSRWIEGMAIDDADKGTIGHSSSFDSLST